MITKKLYRPQLVLDKLYLGRFPEALLSMAT